MASSEVKSKDVCELWRIARPTRAGGTRAASHADHREARRRRAILTIAGHVTQVCVITQQLWGPSPFGLGM